MNSLSIAGALLIWFDVHKRILPWRGSGDPYQVWIAEIIFQQTRIEQGMGYFIRFLEKFPDISVLASASEDEVLNMWQGLGYYSRARNLLSAAKRIVTEKNGHFPDSYKGLVDMKGVGEYTAASIASVCFKEPVPAVDGNVFRIFSRLFELSDPVGTAAGLKRVKKISSGFVDLLRPGDYNEALMDLGAMVCKPKNPSCFECPLARNCLAFKNKSVTDYPVKRKLVQKKQRWFHYFLIEKDGMIFISKRTQNDIWKGLFELPLIESHSEKIDKINDLQKIFCIDHQLTHQQLNIYFYKTDAELSPFESLAEYLQVKIQEVFRYAFPKPIIEFLKSHFDGLPTNP